MVIPKCNAFIHTLYGAPSYYTEEGRLSKVERIQYVSKFDILSRSFTLYAAIDGALHHPTPVACKESTPRLQSLKNTERK
jgi:hypothetical protein